MHSLRCHRSCCETSDFRTQEGWWNAMSKARFHGCTTQTNDLSNAAFLITHRIQTLRHIPHLCYLTPTKLPRAFPVPSFSSSIGPLLALFFQTQRTLADEVQVDGKRHKRALDLLRDRQRSSSPSASHLVLVLKSDAAVAAARDLACNWCGVSWG